MQTFTVLKPSLKIKISNFAETHLNKSKQQETKHFGMHSKFNKNIFYSFFHFNLNKKMC